MPDFGHMSPQELVNELAYNLELAAHHPSRGVRRLAEQDVATIRSELEDL